jgi:hypothetical protein
MVPPAIGPTGASPRFKKGTDIPASMAPFDVWVKSDPRSFTVESGEYSVEESSGEVVFTATPTSEYRMVTFRIDHLVGFADASLTKNCVLTLLHPSGQRVGIRTYAEQRPTTRQVGGLPFYVFERKGGKQPYAMMAAAYVESIRYEGSGGH